MIEISAEIPFLRTSKLVFLIWDESPGSLETWDWNEGITIFFQTRRAGELEFRFGPPLWGIPTETNRLEFPFVSIHNISTNKYLASELVRLGEDKTIYVLIPKGMESEARSVFARLEYLWDDKISPDRITHKFGLTGRTGSVSETQNSNHHVSIKNTIAHPPLEFVGKFGRKRVKEEILVSANEARIDGMNPDLEEAVRDGVSSIDDSPNHPYDLIESSFAESEISNDESSKKISLSETITTEIKEEKKEEVGERTLDGSSETKFSLQLKMMGVISLLFALSVSVIIFFASFYFKRSIELQLRDNNIRIAEIIGSKVKSDILGVVEKGRQIAITLTTQGLPEAERKLLIKTFFQNDKEFIYLGIFERKENSLVMKREVFNEEELKKVLLQKKISMRSSTVTGIHWHKLLMAKLFFLIRVQDSKNLLLR